MAFLFVFVIPFPIYYYYRRDNKLKKVLNSDSDPWELTENPLGPERGVSPGDKMPSKDSDGVRALARKPIAKLQRENADLKEELLELKTKLIHVEAKAGAKDAVAILSSEAAAKSPFGDGGDGENSALSLGFAHVAELKTLAEDGTLSTRVWEAAKQQLDEKLSADIKVARVQQRLDSEKNFEDMLHKDAARLKDRDQPRREARASLREWLMGNRLLHHEQTFLEVAGRALSVDDLRLCRKEDIEQMQANMTFLESMRFNAAIENLQKQFEFAESEPEPEPQGREFEKYETEFGSRSKSRSRSGSPGK